MHLGTRVTARWPRVQAASPPPPARCGYVLTELDVHCQDIFTVPCKPRGASQAQLPLGSTRSLAQTPQVLSEHARGRAPRERGAWREGTHIRLEHVISVAPTVQTGSGGPRALAWRARSLSMVSAGPHAAPRDGRNALPGSRRFPGMVWVGGGRLTAQLDSGVSWVGGRLCS